MSPLPPPILESKFLQQIPVWPGRGKEYRTYSIGSQNLYGNYTPGTDKSDVEAR
jgi:hypothetical protein